MTFSKQFIEIMDALAEKVGIIIDWTSKNIVPYMENLVERFIKYETYTSLVWLILGAIIFIVCLIALIAAFKEDVDTGALASFILCIPILVSIMMIVNQSIDIVEVNTIPEKTIMEFIKYNTDILDK